MTIPFSDEQIEKFWSKVDKTSGLGKGDCWLWKGRRNRGGYGTLNSKAWHGQQLAHRVSCWIATGELDEKHIICHRCHIPSCVRPEHLYAGTHATNGKDKAESGRASALRGDLNGNAIFSWKQVHKIRYDFNYLGVSIGKLAKQYDCPESGISRIVNNLTWVDKSYEAPPDDGRGQPKLSQEKAKLIREIYAAEDCTFKTLAKRFNINKLEIARVIRNQIWVDSEYTPPANLDERTKEAKTFRGEDNGFSKLTWNDVNEIRASFKDGETVLKDVAEKYGVDQSLIALVIDNKAWKDNSYLPPDRTRIERKIPKGMDAEIYRLYKEEGIKQKDIAARFGVNPSKISVIVSRFKKKNQAK